MAQVLEYIKPQESDAVGKSKEPSAFMASHQLFDRPCTSKNAKFICLTSVLSEYSAEYSLVLLTPIIVKFYKIERSPYARLDYVGVKSDCLRKLSLSLRAVSGKHAPVMRSHLYEILPGDIVRVYNPPSNGTRFPSLVSRSLVAGPANAMQSSHVVKLHSSVRLPPLASYFSCDVRDFGMVVRIDTAKQKASIVSLCKEKAVQCYQMTCDCLELEYDRSVPGYAALRMAGIHDVVANKDRAAANLVLEAARAKVALIKDKDIDDVFLLSDTPVVASQPLTSSVLPHAASSSR
jgi:hypothetical protein